MKPPRLWKRRCSVSCPGGAPLRKKRRWAGYGKVATKFSSNLTRVWVAPAGILARAWVEALDGAQCHRGARAIGLAGCGKEQRLAPGACLAARLAVGSARRPGFLDSRRSTPTGKQMHAACCASSNQSILQRRKKEYLPTPPHRPVGRSEKGRTRTM